MKNATALSFRFPAVLALVCLPSLTQAAEIERTSRGHQRGFVGGFTLGSGGILPCDDHEDCPPDAAGAIHVGVMPRRDLAVVADFSVVRSQNARPDSLGVAAVALQYWPADRLWVKAGAGGSRVFDWHDWGHAENPGRRRLTGIAAVGYEVVRGDVFSLDLQVRGAFTAGKQSVAVGLGFNWY